MKNLYSDLNKLSNLLYKQTSVKTSVKTSIKTSIKTNKNKKSSIPKTLKKYVNSHSKTNVSFKRKPKQKRFKKPFLLSLNKNK
jgi:hypothetical protein